MAKPQTIELAREYSTISREEILARLQDRALAIVNVMPPDSFKAAISPDRSIFHWRILRPERANYFPI